MSSEETKGKKYDAGKPPISLIPVEAILEEAEVFGFGKTKYGAHNFRLGMEYSRVIDALMRHTLAIVNGEDIDQESGLPHRAHARCCLSMLTYFQRNNIGIDDRYRPSSKKASIIDGVVITNTDAVTVTNPPTRTIYKNY